MKIRNGFVSNSSSSSFVVILPKNFDPDSIDYSKYDNLGEIKKSENNAIAKELKKLIKRGEMNDEEMQYACVISECLQELGLVIASVETGPDGSGGIIVANYDNIVNFMETGKKPEIVYSPNDDYDSEEDDADEEEMSYIQKGLVYDGEDEDESWEALVYDGEDEDDDVDEIPRVQKGLDYDILQEYINKKGKDK